MPLIRLLVVLFCIMPLSPAAAGDYAEANIEIREWTVPWPDTRPRDPAVAPDGRIWFVGQKGDYVGVFNPENEAFKRYQLAEGVGPHTVIVDQRAVWYAGNRADHIGRLNPETGKINRIPVKHEGEQDPHTMAFTDAGDIWFTMQMASRIGLLDTHNREIRIFRPSVANARPYGLQLDDKGRPWVALFGTNRVATVAPERGQVREFELPRAGARPRRLAITDNGRVWYVDYRAGYLGHYDTETKQFREWRTPAAARAGPYGMAADGKGRLWFVETGVEPNRVVGFLPEKRRFTKPRPIPSGGGTVRNMVYDDSRNAIWFGADTNTIGRIRLDVEQEPE